MTDNNRIKFEKGDIVFIRNKMRRYTTYYDAFKFFHILKYGKKYGLCENDISIDLKSEEEALRKWMIVDYAKHPFDNTILYCIKNGQGNFLVIAESGLKELYINNNHNKKYDEIPKLP